ncbi:uncharacterized protein ARMOST_03205 [Armillaria ostoyae]|uniref:Uncharacterized protein n=1 Tax=Armillaria ostoyae TaxID=47428 RepID=A0A284QTT2_ARMOS|nr:uncharacterized protein ARMOST_03205 [Armillaria ostoyae]
MQKVLEEAEELCDQYITYWNLPDKVPNWQRPLWKREDRYSVPRPPTGKGRPDPLLQPISNTNNRASHLGIKPMMLQTLKPFKDDHNNIEQFLGDCITYFEAFASYFLLPFQTVPFAASYFEGSAKDW